MIVPMKKITILCLLGGFSGNDDDRLLFDTLFHCLGCKRLCTICGEQKPWFELLKNQGFIFGVNFSHSRFVLLYRYQSKPSCSS